jgi:hypothetical protein
MTTNAISGVYLSGWEYNRLLQPNPCQPASSALPASLLWSGSHQLWMFETIYCARESYENEVEATDRLGWIMGEVLRDLSGSAGAVKTIDFGALESGIADQLKLAQRKTLQETPADAIRDAIIAGDATALELAKGRLLRPVLTSHNCIQSGAPNSINAWIGNQQQPRPNPTTGLTMVAAPVVSGSQICRPPGTGVSPEARAREAHVRDTLEAPMIPELLASEGRFAGSAGFIPYLRALEPVREVYEPINEQLRSDWRSHRDDLLRLREMASRYLWPDLHGYWLPRLAAEAHDARVDRDFERWVGRAMKLAPIARFLTSTPVKISFLMLAGAATAAATSGLAAGHLPSSDIIGGAAGSAATGIGTWLSRQRFADQARRDLSLAMFYQLTQT